MVRRSPRNLVSGQGRASCSRYFALAIFRGCALAPWPLFAAIPPRLSLSLLGFRFAPMSGALHVGRGHRARRSPPGGTSARTSCAASRASSTPTPPPPRACAPRLADRAPAGGVRARFGGDRDAVRSDRVAGAKRRPSKAPSRRRLRRAGRELVGALQAQATPARRQCSPGEPRALAGECVLPGAAAPVASPVMVARDRRGGAMHAFWCELTHELRLVVSSSWGASGEGGGLLWASCLHEG